MGPIIEKANGLPVTAHASFGFDGAQQRAYNGPSYFAKGDDVGNIIYGGLSLSTITLNDGSDTLLYKVPNMASVENERPVLLINGKETEVNVKQIMDIFEDEYDIAKKEPFVIHHDGKSLEVWFHLSFSQLDGKVTKIIQGRLGSFCLLCSATRNEAHDIKMIKNGFAMDLSTEIINETYDALKEKISEDNTDGKEYFMIDRMIPNEIRIGLTQEPLATEIPIASYLPPLHCKLRAFNWILDIILRFDSGKTQWYARIEGATEAYALSKARFTEFSEEVLGTQIFSITGDTGNIVESFFAYETRNKVFNMMAEIKKPTSRDRSQRMEYKLKVEQKEHFIKVWSDVMQRIWIIIRIINSDLLVLVEDFEDYCTDTMILIRTELPWVQFSPTVHEFLSHSPQIIKDNGSRGLLNHSEQGSEAAHKLVRYLRERGARKISLEANLQDVFMKLWIITNPAVRCYNRTQTCSYCLMDGHNVRSCPKRESTTKKPKSPDDLILESLTCKEDELD